MICVLAGGVGAARFLRGLLAVVDPAEVVAIVNTGDDTVFHGLHVAPDIDTCVYTLAGAIDPERGWGLGGETWQAMAGLARHGAHGALTWFNLGDRDLGTHLWRTGRLREGATLTDVTREQTLDWNLGLRLLPMTDQPVATMLRTEAALLGFQEYFVRHHHNIAVSEVFFAGIAAARPAPGVLEAIAAADAIVIAPSNPIVSIGPVLAVPGVRDAIAARRANTVAVSPIIAGAALKGPADRLLTELGHDASVVGVARLYRELASALVIDTADAALSDDVAAVGMRAVVTDTIMASPDISAALARTTLEAAR